MENIKKNLIGFALGGLLSHHPFGINTLKVPTIKKILKKETAESQIYPEGESE